MPSKAFFFNLEIKRQKSYDGMMQSKKKVKLFFKYIFLKNIVDFFYYYYLQFKHWKITFTTL